MPCLGVQCFVVRVCVWVCADVPRVGRASVLVDGGGGGYVLHLGKSW